MRILTKIGAMCIVLALATAGLAAPTVVFQDDFEADGPPGGNFNNFINWSVSNGYVDLIGTGFWPELWPGPQPNKAVDMDGSGNDPGKIATKAGIALAPGPYVLEFKLAGSQRPGSPSDTVDVMVGSVFSKSYTLPYTAGIQLIQEPFVVAVGENAVISFEDPSVARDNIGLLLDDVKLTAIPAPGAALLVGIGTGLVGWFRRKRAL